MALGSLRGVLFFYERNIEMKDLLISIAQGLVEEPDAVTVTVDEPDDEALQSIISTSARMTWAELSASRAE